MKTLFDTYSIAIISKSRRSILDALDREMCRYAYIANNHITLSNISGLSHTDAVIKSIDSQSFGYIEGVTEDRSFLLVVGENEILFSGMINNKEIDSKLSLYKLRMSDNFTVHIYNSHITLSEKYTTETLPESFENKIKDNACQLIDIKEIKSKLNKSVLLLKAGLFILTLLVLSIYLFTNYENNKQAIKQAKQERQIVDAWHDYRESLHQPAIDSSFDSLDKNIRPLRTLGRTPLTHFSFNGQSLSAKLSDFSMPAMYFTSWAKDHHFYVTTVTPTEFSVRKSVFTRTGRKNNIIFDALDVEYKLMDDIKSLNNKNINILFAKENRHINYETIAFTINIKNQPMLYIKQLLHQYHQYPVALNNVDGNLNRGLFTGRISAQITGGLS